MWNIRKESENYKSSCENRWPLEGCGEGYDEQYDWTQVTCYRLGFSARNTEAAGSSGTWVPLCFLCRKNRTFRYYLVEFESGPDSVGFMVDKVALGKVYLRVLCFITVIIIRVHINVPYSPSKIYLIKRAGNTWGTSNKSGEYQGKKTLSLLLLFMPLPKGQVGIGNFQMLEF